MPAGLSSADRRLLWGAVLLVVLLAGGSLLIGPELAGEGSPIPSSYSGDSGGALAAYLLLGDLGYYVQRWQEPPGQLQQQAPAFDAVLILAEPTEPPTPADRDAVTRFVTSGGRVLFTGRNVGLFFDVNPSPAMAAAWEQYEAALPSPYTAGAPRIDMRALSRWPTVRAPQVPLYGPASDPVAVAWPIGQGEVIWWAGAGPLTNVGIPRAGNLRLFLNAMNRPDGERRLVYWDEYFHGQRGSLWSYVARTPVAWGLAQLGVLLVAVIFTYSRRSGPMVEPAPVSRQSPLEFVDTMGSLYQRAKATPIPIETAYRALRLALAQRLAMPVAAPDAQLAAAAEDRLGIDAEELTATLDRARTTRPARKETLELVQALMRYILQLKETR